MRFRQHYELRLTVLGRVVEETRPMEVTRLTETQELVTRAMVKTGEIKEDTMKIQSVWVGTMCTRFIHPRGRRNWFNILSVWLTQQFHIT